jgi:hypothetical protein
MSVVDDSFGHPMKLEEGASAPLAGGIMSHGFQCGMLWGAALAGGAEAYRRFGPGPQAETEAMVAAQKVVESFRGRTKDEINCLEISHLDLHGNTKARSVLKFLGRGGPIYCFHLAAGYAPEASSTIESALSEEYEEAPSPPVSCAAMLARKMGETDMHAAMAAGFAGGIGFSGGACGALGAAIWISAMKRNKDGGGKIGLNDPEAMELIDRFVEASDYEFECSEIVGRNFADINDHAYYLHDGGCSKIIEALAT